MTEFDVGVLVNDDDVVALADGVALVDGELYDALRHGGIELNASAQFICEQISSPRRVGAVAEALATRYSISFEQSAADTRALCCELDRDGMLTLRRPLMARVHPARMKEAAIRVFTLGWGVPPAHRYRNTPLGFVGAVTRATWPLLLGGILCTAFIVGLMAVVWSPGATASNVRLDTAFYPLWGVLLLVFLLSVHEGAHAMVARNLAGAPFLTVRGTKIAVSHRARSAEQVRRIAAAGPLAALTVGFAVTGWLAPFDAVASALAALAALPHLWSLLPWSADGDHIWRRERRWPVSAAGRGGTA